MSILSLLNLLRNNWELFAVIAGMLLLYGYAHHEGAMAEKAKWDASIEQMQKEADERSKKLETELAKQREENRNVNVQLETAISTADVYRKCKLSPDGLRAIQNAIGSR